MNDFSEIELCPALRANLKKHGFTKPTPVQALAIAPAMAGRDVVATAETGTGKTLAFGLPILQQLSMSPGDRGPNALILAPTRELALQIEEAFARMAVGTGLRTAVAVGGMSEGNQLRSIRKGAHILIATPGRLVDYLQRRLVDMGRVKMVVLDEADRMLDMGFLPSIREILNTLPTPRQTMLFSATLDAQVGQLASTYVKNAVRIETASSAKPVDLVDLHAYEIEHDRKLDLLTHLLREEKGAFLVFTRTKHGTDRLATRLAHAGIHAARIHGGRSQSQRNQALRGFKDGGYRVLVATDVAARGIHVDSIAHVVNYDLPQQPEDFVHRVGRTGRAGSRGVAWTFGTRSERHEIKRIERVLGIRMTRREAPASPMAH